MEVIIYYITSINVKLRYCRKTVFSRRELLTLLTDVSRDLLHVFRDTVKHDIPELSWFNIFSQSKSEITRLNRLFSFNVKFWLVMERVQYLYLKTFYIPYFTFRQCTIYNIFFHFVIANNSFTPNMLFNIRNMYVYY